MSKLKSRSGGLVVLFCVLALLAAAAAPALAHHRDDHSQGGNFQEADQKASQSDKDNDGDADSDSSSTQTENDSDPRESTPEDQADDGDNAHPSGKDRSVESGKATKNPNQGKAESNPDDSKGPQRWEGAAQQDDKPNALGGVDAADQDGNNGCGNDDDFDDDNNGHCGPRVKPSPSPTVVVNTCPTNSALPMNHPDCDVVRGGGGERCPTNPALPMGHKDCGVVGGSGSELCPAGTDNAGKPMDSVANCNEDDVEGRVDQANPLKVCPSGPFKGMPFDDRDECDTDRVSPSRIVRGAVAGTVDAARGAARAVGAALPFTGAGDLMFLLGISALLLGGGTLALRIRGAKAE